MAGDRRSVGSDPGALYCSNCGVALESGANYCSNCGEATDSSTRPRDGTRSASTAASPASTAAAKSRPPPEAGGRGSVVDAVDRSSLERRIAAATADGWSLEHDFGDHVVMVRRSVGGVNAHALIAVSTGWWTMGVGNALYGAYRYFGDADRMVLRASDAANDPASSISRVRDWAVASVGWLAAAVVAALALQTSALASVVLLTLAVVVAVAATTALPSVATRLEHRRPITANGHVRWVDERAVVAPGEPCGACAAPVERGLERTYRKAFCVLGVPLTTTAGRNYYCRRCANAESAAMDEAARSSAPSDRAGRRASAAESDREPERD